jgi:hypothetical protein
VRSIEAAFGYPIVRMTLFMSRRASSAYALKDEF